MTLRHLGPETRFVLRSLPEFTLNTRTLFVLTPKFDNPLNGGFFQRDPRSHLVLKAFNALRCSFAGLLVPLRKPRKHATNSGTCNCRHASDCCSQYVWVHEES